MVTLYWTAYCVRCGDIQSQMFPAGVAVEPWARPSFEPAAHGQPHGSACSKSPATATTCLIRYTVRGYLEMKSFQQVLQRLSCRFAVVLLVPAASRRLLPGTQIRSTTSMSEAWLIADDRALHCLLRMLEDPGCRSWLSKGRSQGKILLPRVNLSSAQNPRNNGLQQLIFVCTTSVLASCNLALAHKLLAISRELNP